MKTLSTLLVSFLIFSVTTTAQTIELQFNKSTYNGGYNISCNGATDGSITMIVIGGSSPYTYQWSNSATTKDISNLAAGTYDVTVTDNNSITATGSVTLLQPGVLGKTLIPYDYNGYNIAIYSGNNGRIDLSTTGGTPPYSFLWSNAATTEDIANLIAGNYSVTVTDMNNCTTTGSITLTQPTQLVINSIASPTNAGGFNINCYNDMNGSAEVIANGAVPPYTYVWSNGLTSNPATGLRANTYSVRVSDINGASITGTITLTQPSQINITSTRSIYSNNYNISCHNCSNGFINSTVTGGVTPYSYTWRKQVPSSAEWTVIASTANITNLDAGKYKLTITDALNCERVSEEYTLIAPQRDDWSMQGNSGTDPNTQYMGTSDSTDFVLRTNAQEALRITSDGDLKVANLGGNGDQYIKVDNDGVISTSPSTNVPWMTEGNDLAGAANPTGQKADEWIGTLRTDDFVIKTNQINAVADNERMRVTWERGLVGIEIYEPKSKLHLNSTEEYPFDTYKFYETPLEWDDNGEEIPISLPENATSIGITTFQITNNNTGTAETDGLIMSVDGTGAVVKNRDGGLQLNASGPVSLNAGNGGRLSLFSSSAQLYSPGRIQMLATNYVRLSTVNSLNAFYIHSDGRVGIGTNEVATDYQLSVYGKIMSEELMVKLKPNWPDYVFKKDYKLMPWEELENFITKKQHLPGIPSAGELEDRGGFEVGEMQRLQMEKIEELYLYVIELNKEVEKLKDENKKLNAKIKNK